MNQVFEEFREIIRSRQRFLVTCHIHPDGDAVGSLLALGLTLQKLGKQVEMICTDGVPTVYQFLERNSLIRRDSDFVPEVLISVDCAEKERVALPERFWEIPGLMLINIDHHITNTNFGHLNIVDPNAAATGEVIFRLLTAGGYELDKSIASAAYTAIATDTGFFRYSSTSSFTLELASVLVKHYQVEPAKIAEQVHDQKSYNSIRLLGTVLNTLQLALEGKVAWLVLSQEMLTRFPVENEETESFVNYARSIEGVEVGILFKELKPDEVKLSWRSSSAVDVSKLAANFGGGGHARAAGCTVTGPLERVISDVVDFVTRYYTDTANAARNIDC